MATFSYNKWASLPQRRNGHWILLLLGALSLTPVLAAWLIYSLALPVTVRSYGQLLDIRPFPAHTMAGWPQRKWVLANVEFGECAADCQHRRFTLHQIRLAQGEAMSRLATVMIHTSGQLSPHYEGVIYAPNLARFARPTGFYLVDPLGNQVMFYPSNANPKKVIQEIGHLLKINNGLG